MVTECPVCTGPDDHPTGRFTQTFGDLLHRSRECAYIATRMSVTAVGLLDPTRRALLCAAKERLESKALPDWRAALPRARQVLERRGGRSCLTRSRTRGPSFYSVGGEKYSTRAGRPAMNGFSQADRAVPIGRLSVTTIPFATVSGELIVATMV